MADVTGSDIYTRLGISHVINAGGSQTALGGSTPSERVKLAMEEAEKTWVDMGELLEKSGARVAELLDVEAAYITAGGYAALALSTAACLTGNDAEKIAQLPDTTGMKNEVIFQRTQSYGFDRAYTIAGGKLVRVGDDSGCTAAQIEAAIGPNTAAYAHFVIPQGDPNGVPLDEAVSIAHAHDVPVVVDAASRIWPLSYFKQMAHSGDLVCFGGKYFNAPQSAGFVVGRKDLIDAVRKHGFISPRPVGRGMKLDRQEIIGVLAGLEDWFSMDHDERFAGYDARFRTILNALEGAPNVVEAKVIESTRHPTVSLQVVFDKASLGKNAKEVADDLYAGSPKIRLQPVGEDGLNISVHTLNDGEDRMVAEGLRRVLSMGG